MIHWIRWIQWIKIFVNTVKGFKPANSFVRDQDATTASARQRRETGSLSWPSFMLQWFMRFPEFAEFIEFPFHLEKIPLFAVLCWNVFINQWLNTSSKQEVCSHVLYSVTDPGFSRRRRQRPSLGQKSIIWQDFCRKPHENEINWTERRGAHP